MIKFLLTFNKSYLISNDHCPVSEQLSALKGNFVIGNEPLVGILMY